MPDLAALDGLLDVPQLRQSIRVPCRDCHRKTSIETAIKGYGPKCARKHGLTVASRRPASGQPGPVRPARRTNSQLSLLDEPADSPHAQEARSPQR